MGIGFQSDVPSTSASGLDRSKDITIPKSAYGLSTRQIAALGFTDRDVVPRYGDIDPVRVDFLQEHLEVDPCLPPQ
jgi:hypothetical protein